MLLHFEAQFKFLVIIINIIIIIIINIIIIIIIIIIIFTKIHEGHDFTRVLLRTLTEHLIISFKLLKFTVCMQSWQIGE